MIVMNVMGMERQPPQGGQNGRVMRALAPAKRPDTGIEAVGELGHYHV